MIRLAGVALQHWRALDGYAAGHGMPPLEDLPIDRFCNFVWWWLTRFMDEDAVHRVEIDVWRPPPGVVPTKGPWTAEAETAALVAVKQQLGR